ncbi:MAG: hypothetical protein NTU58_01340 [Candidatus Nealsonbacteria bacterium]|nr:hypothetical protein [Candidatus Nealsonbacteria bacterium]
MQIFEFHFNPKKKEGLVFDSFVYEPENIYEQKLGNLYMVGELTNALPQNYQFLSNLALTIKNSFYHISAKSAAESSLRNSLKEANKFLENQEKNGNVDWLGNLNFAQISLKDFNLNFTKVGDIKVILCRERKIMDIGKELERSFSESYPLKIFSKIISGKLAQQDKIIILTKEAYELFSKEDFFSEIILVFEKNLPQKAIEEEIKKVLNKKRGLLSEISGVFILISLDSAQNVTVNVREPVVSKKKIDFKLPAFGDLIKVKNIKELSGRTKNILEKLFFYLKKIFDLKKTLDLKRIKSVGIYLKEKIKNIRPKIRIKLPEKISFLRVFSSKKILLIIFILILMAGSGMYLSEKNKQKEIIKFQGILEQIKQKASEAENALIYRDEKKSNLLYQEAWKEISGYLSSKNPLEKEFFEVKNSIEKELFALNKTIQNPNLNPVFDFEGKNFSPQKILLAGLNLYFINNSSNKVYSFNLKQKSNDFVEIPETVKLGAILKDFPILLSNNNKLIYLNKKEKIAPQTIENPYPDFNFIDFAIFGSNLYFLESNKKEIIKFSFKESENKISGEAWLSPETKKPANAPLSMAIDGSLWLLNENQTISKYYKGEAQEDINLDFFPYIEKPAKIFTQAEFSYLYILTQAQNRIVVLDKKGVLLKQYKFDDLNDIKDFIISKDEKTAYLINGLKVLEFKL